MDLPRGRDNPSTKRRPLSHVALFYSNEPSRNSPNSKASLTSFAGTQHYKSAQEGSNASGRLDHEKSRLAIRELLDLRRQRMKSASGRRDLAELFRLQNLNVFEGLECTQRADAEDESLTMAGYGENEGEAVAGQETWTLSHIPRRIGATEPLSMMVPATSQRLNMVIQSHRNWKRLKATLTDPQQSRRPKHSRLSHWGESHQEQTTPQPRVNFALPNIRHYAMCQ